MGRRRREKGRKGSGGEGRRGREGGRACERMKPRTHKVASPSAPGWTCCVMVR